MDESKLDIYIRAYYKYFDTLVSACGNAFLDNYFLCIDLCKTKVRFIIKCIAIRLSQQKPCTLPNIMKTVQYILIILSLVQISCLNKKSNEKIKSTNEPARPISVLKDLVLNKGDIEAYEELETAYLDHAHGDFFEIAKVMADKYDYPRAYYDVYLQILKPTQNPERTISLDSCTAEEKKEAVLYLKKAFEKGFEPAGKELEFLKQKGYTY